MGAAEGARARLGAAAAEVVRKSGGSDSSCASADDCSRAGALQSLLEWPRVPRPTLMKVRSTTISQPDVALQSLLHKGGVNVLDGLDQLGVPCPASRAVHTPLLVPMLLVPMLQPGLAAAVDDALPGRACEPRSGVRLPVASAAPAARAGVGPCAGEACTTGAGAATRPQLPSQLPAASVASALRRAVPCLALRPLRWRRTLCHSC